MRAAWVAGVVDESTLVWGQGLEAWYPIRNVVGLTTNIQSLDGARRRTPCVRCRSPLSPWAAAGQRQLPAQSRARDAPARVRESTDAAYATLRCATRRREAPAAFGARARANPTPSRTCALTWTFAPPFVPALSVLVFKWLHDKFILRPRLERVRAQVRPGLARALARGWLARATDSHACAVCVCARFFIFRVVVARSARRR
jgi:hypothetical protein